MIKLTSLLSNIHLVLPEISNLNSTHTLHRRLKSYCTLAVIIHELGRDRTDRNASLSHLKHLCRSDSKTTLHRQLIRTTLGVSKSI